MGQTNSRERGAEQRKREELHKYPRANFLPKMTYIPPKCSCYPSSKKIFEKFPGKFAIVMVSHLNLRVQTRDHLLTARAAWANNKAAEVQ